MTRSTSPKTPSAGATSCSRRCSNRATSPKSSTTKGPARRCPPRATSPPPTLDSKAPVLHRLDAPAAGRPLWSRESVLRRAEGEVDARPPPPAGGGRSGQQLSRVPASHGRRSSSSTIKTPASRRWSAVPTSTRKPFNLATLGHRQPGSSIKPFTLVTALEEGISPYTVYESAPQTFHFGKNGKEVFEVSNDEDSYLGSCDIVCATTYSDNSIYAQLALEGLKGKTSTSAPPRSRRRSTRWATGRRSRPTRRWCSAGLKEGVTPLEWTYAYMTLANDGDRVSGTLAPEPGDSPVAYTEVTDQRGKHRSRAATTTRSTSRRSPKKPRRRRRESWKRWSAAAPARTPTSAPPGSGARRGPRRTTATPGSAARPKKSPPASGSATRIRRRR